MLQQCDDLVVRVVDYYVKSTHLRVCTRAEPIIFTRGGVIYKRPRGMLLKEIPMCVKRCSNFLVEEEFPPQNAPPPFRNH
jgi:hypothetical protein